MKNLNQVSQDEHNLILYAQQEYGIDYDSAQEIALLYGKFIKSVSADHFVFLSFLSQFNKFLILSILSAVRRHQVQAMLGLRQCIETGMMAAYAITVVNPKNFAIKKADGTLQCVEKSKDKCFKWIEQKYPQHSKALYGTKTKYINGVFAHANFISTQANFQADQRKFHIVFWDETDLTMVKSSLWIIANAALCILDIIYNESKSNSKIKVDPDFKDVYARLKKTNDALRDELKKHPRFSKWDIKNPAVLKGLS